MIAKIRRHANFVEYVPLIVVMMAMIEINGAHKWWLHVFGVTIVVARIIHPLGIMRGVTATLRSTFELFGILVATLALVVAFLASRTRPRTHRARRRIAFGTTA